MYNEEQFTPDEETKLPADTAAGSADDSATAVLPAEGDNDSLEVDDIGEDEEDDDSDDDDAAEEAD